MRRREFITLLGGAAAWPLAASAQQPGERVRRIAALMTIAESDPEARRRKNAFEDALQKLGWSEGRNLRIDYRWTVPDLDRIRAYAAELAELAPDAILAQGPPALAALQGKTHAIPIVFVQVADPVTARFVASLAHPGGNITGFTSFEDTMSAKWLSQLKELAPHTARVGVLLNRTLVSASNYTMPALEAAAPSLGLELISADVHDLAGIERGFDEFVRRSVDALVVMPDAAFSAYRVRIIELASMHRLPAIYYYSYFARSGGLMSYGPDPLDHYHKAAGYIDRILRGEKPANLPVQQPTKFELVINLKTAKALGLAVPPTLLALADEVIE
jgi:putative tryptophan/tyrosine transport system substrate-binding protein